MINFSKSANPTSIYFNFSPFEFYSRSKVLEVNPQTLIPTISEGSPENKSNVLNLQTTKNQVSLLLFSIPSSLVIKKLKTWKVSKFAASVPLLPASDTRKLSLAPNLWIGGRNKRDNLITLRERKKEKRRWSDQIERKRKHIRDIQSNGGKKTKKKQMWSNQITRKWRRKNATGIIWSIREKKILSSFVGNTCTKSETRLEIGTFGVSWETF